MRRILQLSLFVIGVVFFPLSVFAADAWPGGSGTVIAELSEPSGAVWHEERGTLFIVEDNGTIHELSTSGTVLNTWSVGGDIEGATLVDGSPYLYIGIENPDSIQEFDIDAGALTGTSWDLTPWMTGEANSGLEGLAYVGEYFFAGLQADGRIYVFSINRAVNNDVTFIEVFDPSENVGADISGIDYSADTGLMYAVFDTENVMVEFNSEGQLVNEYTLPGDNQEGVALQVNCEAGTAVVYIAEDDGQVMSYPDYPVECVSEDEEDSEDDEAEDEDSDEENSDEEDDEPPFYSNLDPTSPEVYEASILSVTGMSNGKIQVTYADQTVVEYEVFSIDTEQETIVQRQRKSGWLLVVNPNGKRMKLVNPYTGEAASTVILSKKQSYTSVALQQYNLRKKQDDAVEAVITSKKGKHVRLTIVKINLGNSTLRKKDTVTVSNQAVHVSNTVLHSKSIVLKTAKEKVIQTYTVTKKYRLIR